MDTSWPPLFNLSAGNPFLYLSPKLRTPFSRALNHIKTSRSDSSLGSGRRRLGVTKKNEGEPEKRGERGGGVAILHLDHQEGSSATEGHNKRRDGVRMATGDGHLLRRWRGSDGAGGRADPGDGSPGGSRDVGSGNLSDASRRNLGDAGHGDLGDDTSSRR